MLFFGLHFFEVTQRVIFQHRIRTIEQSSDQLDHRRVVTFTRAENEQCRAALLDRALFDQGENILQSVIHNFYSDSTSNLIQS